MATRKELVARYEADEEFPGYNLSEEQVARFWQISADNLAVQGTLSLKAQLERILARYGSDADEAMYCFLGSEDITQLLDAYQHDEDWPSVPDDNWKEGYLIADILYLNDNYPGQLAEIWMSETRWAFWEYFTYGRSETAFNAVVEFLSGYSTLFQWVEAC